MNFLLRTAQPAVQDDPSVNEPSKESDSVPKPRNTLEGLIAEDPFSQSEDGDGIEGQSTGNADPSTENAVPIYGNHSDVAEHEGWITIPYKELPDNWSDAPDILSFRSLDRSFVFPGEQVHLLACLSSSKQDTQIITPFKVAAVMSKNGILGQNCKKQNGNKEIEENSVQEGGEENIGLRDAANGSTEQNAETMLTKKKIDTQVDISAGESLLRIEDHRKQTETQLARFKNSHFFVRIAESDEPLWSKRSMQEPSSVTADLVGDKLSTAGARRTFRNDANHISYIDRGSFDANISGGVARNAVKCCSLSNGDVVVLLQVNVGINFLKFPILEILQFEKYQDTNLTSEKTDDLGFNTNQKDPCNDLLKWLLPLDHTLPPPARLLSPPPLSSSGIGSVSHKSGFSASTGSQLFSFGHFRSYSMSTLPPNTVPLPVTTSTSKPISDLQDRDHFSLQKPFKSQESGNAGLQSFRGVSLEPERFSVHCGLEGIYIPGRRWRKKLEIIQPVEIHTFAAECDTEDLLSVQIKNVSPPHVPDIVIFLDAITIIFEEAPRGGRPVSLPIACIEAGNDCSLPDLALRRNEEHSFILRPASSMWRNFKAHNEKSFQPSQSKSGGAMPNLHLPSKTGEGKGLSYGSDQYAVLISCRCNYTESRLFFKHPINWRPRVARDLMISVASEMSEQSCVSSGGLTQLPVQVLTLQVSNLTTEDLTMTVLAPASVTSPPSVISLTSSPSTPMSPFLGFSEFAGILSRERRSNGVQRLSSAPLESDNQKEKVDAGARSASFNEQTVSISDVIPSNGLGCTHLWLQSTVPLGCVPFQSTATVKLELLPLTDGIITLDTLQINVKEKGMTYIPEHSLKINATSSIATGIM